MLLAGDIGGTKTILALFEPADDPKQPLHEMRFPSQEYDSLEAIITEYLTEVDTEVDAAAFGVAGPVMNGHAQITNLPWEMDQGSLSSKCDLPKVQLANDLMATASAVPFLTAEDLEILNPGEPDGNGTLGIIGPGTGLGVAYLTHDGNRYRAYPSEGGHSSFSPTNEFELELLRYLSRRFNGHVSTERVASGSGIPNIYDYFKEAGYAPEPAWLAEALAETNDKTPIIVENALSENPCDLATITLDTFVSILGGEAADMALTFLATGGIFLGGGIPPRILPALKSDHFYRAFTTKGRFSKLMTRIPVHVILNPKTALLGAARIGMNLLND